jgi:hypothetical protein
MSDGSILMTVYLLGYGRKISSGKHHVLPMKGYVIVNRILGGNFL